MQTITPKNWSTFQHYKDRSPSWIKLHRTMLDNYDFACLPVASRALAPMLWLLASEYDKGQITATNDEIAFRLRMPVGDLEQAMKPLITKEFFSYKAGSTKPLAAQEQHAILEREEETEKEGETEIEKSATSSPPVDAANGKGPKQPKLPLEPKRRATRLPDDWKPSTKNNEDARGEGLTEVEMAKEAVKFRNYWHAKGGSGATKMNWDATWHNWCIEAARRLGRSPPPKPAEHGSPPPQLSIDEWKLVLRNYAMTSNWKSVYGPPPGAPGCRVPKDLLPDDLGDPGDGGGR